MPNFVSTTGTGKVLQVFGIVQYLPFCVFFFYSLSKMHWGSGGGNSPLCPLQEEFHACVLQGVRNVSGTL